MQVFQILFAKCINVSKFRLLAFGSSAHTILNKKEFNSIHAVDSVIFTKFFAPMTSLIVEDVIRNELSRATGNS